MDFASTIVLNAFNEVLVSVGKLRVNRGELYSVIR